MVGLLAAAGKYIGSTFAANKLIIFTPDSSHVFMDTEATSSYPKDATCRNA